MRAPSLHPVVWGFRGRLGSQQSQEHRLKQCSISLSSSGVTVLWQVPRVTPVAVLNGTKFPPQAALLPLALSTSFLLPVLWASHRSLGSAQGLGLDSCLSDFSPLVCQGLPWRGGPKIQDFVSSQSHPQLSFCHFKLGETKLKHSSAFELFKFWGQKGQCI